MKRDSLFNFSNRVYGGRLTSQDRSDIAKGRRMLLDEGQWPHDDHPLELLKFMEVNPDMDFDGIQPFVFPDNSAFECLSELELPEDGILASPFPFFSIEVEGGKNLHGDIGNAIELDEEGWDNCGPTLLVVRELLPGEYDIYGFFKQDALITKLQLDGIGLNQVLQAIGKIGCYPYQTQHLEKEGRFYHNQYAIGMVNHYLSLMATSDKALFTPKGSRVKLGSGKGKYIYKPKDVVYVGKKSKKSVATQRGDRLNWDHSWTVMGHWRRVKGMGKDRKGERVVEGYTWVVPHVKGDGALVDKVRKVV